MHLTCTNMPIEKLDEALNKVRHLLLINTTLVWVY